MCQVPDGFAAAAALPADAAERYLPRLAVAARPTYLNGNTSTSSSRRAEVRPARCRCRPAARAAVWYLLGEVSGRGRLGYSSMCARCLKITCSCLRLASSSVTYRPHAACRRRRRRRLRVASRRLPRGRPRWALLKYLLLLRYLLLHDTMNTSKVTSRVWWLSYIT